MRKIETAMNRAVRRMLTVNDNEPFSAGNTAVMRNYEGVVIARLHGHVIAHIRRVVTGYAIIANSCGWKTATTKSRLNALLAEFRPGNSIYQKAGAWYVRTPGGNTYAFYDGIKI